MERRLLNRTPKPGTDIEQRNAFAYKTLDGPNVSVPADTALSAAPLIFNAASLDERASWLHRQRAEAFTFCEDGVSYESVCFSNIDTGHRVGRSSLC
jgi:hypothetical protein